MVVPPDLEQLREARSQVGERAGNSWRGAHFLVRQEVVEAADFLLSVLDEGGRLERVVLCEHGFDESHRVFTDARGMERCAKGSRTVVWPPKEDE
jgi:hypothetical protein